MNEPRLAGLVVRKSEVLPFDGRSVGREGGRKAGASGKFRPWEEGRETGYEMLSCLSDINRGGMIEVLKSFKK